MKTIDLHTHTTPASGCSRLRPDDLIQRAKQLGLDGVCLTEHQVTWDTYSVRQLSRHHDFLVLRGVEITTLEGDILVYGAQIFSLPHEIQGVISSEKLRKMVNQRSGIMVAAHPLRGCLLNRDGYNPEVYQQKVRELSTRQIFRWVDAVEGLNGNTSPIQNQAATQVGEMLGLRVTGGSDAHIGFDVGRCATVFEEDIGGEEELVQALREGKFRAVSLNQNGT